MQSLIVVLKLRLYVISFPSIKFQILFPNVLPPSPLENTDIMRLVYWCHKMLRIKDLLLQLN